MGDEMPPAENADDERGDARLQLMEAAAVLFAEKSKVSVREIAKAAGVNHGLVHYYFGSKEQLKRESFSHLVDKAAAEIPLTRESTSEEIVDTITALYEEQRTTMRMGLRSLLDGEETFVTGRGFPIVAKLVEVILPDDPKQSVLATNALLTSLNTSITARVWMVAATGLDEALLASFARNHHVELLRSYRDKAVL